MGPSSPPDHPAVGRTVPECATECSDGPSVVSPSTLRAYLLKPLDDVWSSVECRSSVLGDKVRDLFVSGGQEEPRCWRHPLHPGTRGVVQWMGTVWLVHDEILPLPLTLSLTSLVRWFLPDDASAPPPPPLAAPLHGPDKHRHGDVWLLEVFPSASEPLWPLRPCHDGDIKTKTRVLSRWDRWGDPFCSLYTLWDGRRYRWVMTQSKWLPEWNLWSPMGGEFQGVCRPLHLLQYLLQSPKDGRDGRNVIWDAGQDWG